MWQTFFPDLVVAVIASLLTVSTGYVTYRVNVRHRENQALVSLLNELHHRRAVAPILNPRQIANASTNDDFLRANSSVLSMKDEIRRARDILRPITTLQEPLSLMVRACNRYLELSSAAPESYMYELEELRIQLSKQVHAIAASRKSIKSVEPGTGAF